MVRVRTGLLAVARCRILAAAALLLAVTGITAPTGALAQDVNEVEPNNSIGTAQNIDAYFSLASNANIQNSTTIPHVTIHGSAPAPDFYSFTVTTANSQGTFDIDNTAVTFDSQINIQDTGGNILAFNDDPATLDPGSTRLEDSRLTYTFATPGTYYVRVFDLNGSASGNYDLHVSLQNASAVPEPASWAMLIVGFGVIGAALRARRRSVRAAAALALV